MAKINGLKRRNIENADQQFKFQLSKTKIIINLKSLTSKTSYLYENMKYKNKTII